MKLYYKDEEKRLSSLKAKSLTLFVAVVLFLHSVALFLFKEGYLLTRLELADVGECVTVAPWLKLSNSTANAQCWPQKPRFDKTLLIIIDALRFDFVSYNLVDQYFTNKLPTIQRILSTKPSHALLYRGLADPPTTTLQRLIAIMTGALPNFVDAGSNFASNAFTEDSLLQQLKRHRRRVVTMGDDTWNMLFDSLINESHPFSSFDVWDLHTVDEGVVSHLYPYLDRKPDWNLMIAHFLGVDHAGHRYGPGHPAMAAKLQQMDGILDHVFNKVDDETLVVVMGDHGMDEKGDHGGDSDNELDAALFFYSKTPLTDTSALGLRQMQQVVDRIDSDLDLHGSHPFGLWQGHRTVPQIDLVPTLAMLMGIPIPFGNLGSIIPELFFFNHRSWWNPSSLSSIQNLLAYARLNALQLHRYISAYSARRSDAQTAFHQSESLFRSAESAFASLSFTSSASDAQSYIDCYLAYVKYQRETLLTARKVWSRFETSLMVMGVAVLLVTQVAVVLFVYKSWCDPDTVVSMASLGVACGRSFMVGGFLFVAVRAIKMAVAQCEASSVVNLGHEVLFSLAMGVAASVLLVVSNIHNKYAAMLSQFSFMGVTGLVMLAACVGSDRFTMFEDHVLNHLIQIFAVFSTFHSIHSSKNTQIRQKVMATMFCFAVSARLVHFATICRSEQGAYCEPTFNHSPETSIASPAAVVYLLVASVGVVCFLNAIIESQGVFSSNSFARVFARQWFAVGVGLSFVYWTLDTLDAHGSLPHELKKTKYSIAKLFWIFLAYCATKFVQTGDSLKHPGTRDDWLLAFTAYVYVVVAFYQKPMGGVVVALGLVQIVCLAHHVSLWRQIAYEVVLAQTKKQSKATHKQVNLNDVYFAHLVVVFLAGQKAFFGTGHQNALTSIQYETGFVGVEGVSWILAPLFIGLNTYGGPILFAMSVPLVLLWRRDDDWSYLVHQIVEYYLCYFGIVQGLCLMSVTFCACWFQKHLQSWRVWGPKFLFFSIGHAATFSLLTALLVITLCVVWRHHS